MGYQERNAWACGCSILVVFTPYFWFVFSNPMAYVALFGVGSMIGMAVLSLSIALPLRHGARFLTLFSQEIW